jgi:citrate synthase
LGEPIVYPRHDYTYCENFLHMMFSLPFREHIPTSEAARILNLYLLLQADNEQNCSTSTVRMVASSKANMFASCAAGVCALWGPLHGADVAVIEMLEQLRASGMSVSTYVERLKAKNARWRLPGFGHRVYRTVDPRAEILQRAADQMLEDLKVSDPLLDIAKELEQTALGDPYFIERRLYPNVELYSGIILRGLGVPLDMFTVMSAIGRMPGWIANWKEIHDDPDSRIYRPRQIYVGSPVADFVPRTSR